MQVIPAIRRLLDVHSMLGSLELINNTDECVAFRVMRNGGIVPARSTYTLIVEHTEGAILESSIMGGAYMSFKDQSECDEFFEEAKEMGNEVHELALEANFARQRSPVSYFIYIFEINTCFFQCLPSTFVCQRYMWH
jgi:hypothetical protein